MYHAVLSGGCTSVYTHTHTPIDEYPYIKLRCLKIIKDWDQVSAVKGFVDLAKVLHVNNVVEACWYMRSSV